ncbi:MAG: glyoxalase [Chloroflexi bacterium]|nr:glyoxalase [Chloroflexota bacterium]
MSQISLIVYPVKDVNAAKQLFNTFLGVEPYIDGAYYVGYKVGDQEVGLDPNGPAAGPIGYTFVSDIKASLQGLIDAGAQMLQDVKDVGYGRLIATVKDASGNIIGLVQNPS